MGGLFYFCPPHALFGPATVLFRLRLRRCCSCYVFCCPPHVVFLLGLAGLGARWLCTRFWCPLPIGSGSALGFPQVSLLPAKLAGTLVNQHVRTHINT